MSITDPAYKQSALRAINAFLASHNMPLSLSLKPLPAAKDINDVFRFLFSCLEFSSSNKLEDDLFLLLKYLNCPHKINKSALRAPGAPHSFPSLLAVMHWLVQLADYADHLRSDENSSRYAFMNDTLMAYAVNSYLPYMKGDDEAVGAMDKELAEKMEKERDLLVGNLKLLDEEGKKLELELEALKSRPSERELYESQRKDLEGDLGKFQGYIASLRDANSITKKALEEKDKELAVKVDEIRRIKEENEDIKKRVEAQGINLRDAERMKRELLAVEREISEAEASRSSWEEKCWDLDAAIGQKFKELEAFSIECNQVLKRLKLGGDFHYELNAKGSTPAEVLGIDYKSTLKPAINSFAEELKKSTTAKLEEFISLQKQSKEMTAKIETKRNHLTALQSHLDERAQEFDAIRNKIEEYRSWCAREAQKIKDDVEAKVHNLDIMEREAIDALKAAELKLMEERKQSEQEIQVSAYELFALIDSVSRYKEHIETKISEMRKELSETAQCVSAAYKSTLSTRLNVALDTTSLRPSTLAARPNIS